MNGKRKEKCDFSVRIAGMKRQNGSVSVRDAGSGIHL